MLYAEKEELDVVCRKLKSRMFHAGKEEHAAAYRKKSIMLHIVTGNRL